MAKIEVEISNIRTKIRSIELFSQNLEVNFLIYPSSKSKCCITSLLDLFFSHIRSYFH